MKQELRADQASDEQQPLQLTNNQRYRLAKLIEDAYPQSRPVQVEPLVNFGSDFIGRLDDSVNLRDLPFAKYNSYAEVYSALDLADKQVLISWLRKADLVSAKTTQLSAHVTRLDAQDEVTNLEVLKRLLTSPAYILILDLVDETFGRDSDNPDDVYELLEYLQDKLVPQTDE